MHSTVKALIFLTLFALTSFGAVSSAAETPTSWNSLQQEVLAHIEQSRAAFSDGDIDAAKEILADAYFEKFEALGMEMEVRKYLSSARAYKLERMFGSIRKAMTKGNAQEVDVKIAVLAKALKQDAAILDSKKIPMKNAGYVITPTADLALTKTSKTPTANQEIDQLSPTDVANKISSNLDMAMAQYRRGDIRSAKGIVTDTYFDLFEAGGLETLIAMKSGSLKTELESKFGAILGLVDKSEPNGRVEEAIKDLSNQISNVVMGLDQSRGWLQLFLASLFIILREGFEAILVLSALIAYLIKTGNPDKVKIVGAGALAAIALSLVTAAGLLWIYQGSGASHENIEGITMLVASAVLFYVSYWLTSKAEAARWMSYIQKQVSRSIGAGSMVALGFAAFIVVYREGAETVLFYAALMANAGDNGGIPIAAGFVAGVMLLVVIYYAFRLGTAKIPLRPFFMVTSAILFAMAFVFAGDGIVELQIGGLLSSTPLDGVPRIVFLGIHPTTESLALQTLLFMSALVALGYLYIIQPFKARGRVLMELSHVLGDVRKLHDRVEHIQAHVKEVKTHAGTEDTNKLKVLGHLNEIDDYSHELIDHLNTLDDDLASIFGTAKSKGEKE